MYSGKAVGHAPLATVFAELAALGGERVVHAGSAWVLEPGVGLDESAAVEPRSPYARHKAEEDELLRGLGEREWNRLDQSPPLQHLRALREAVAPAPVLVSRLSRGEPADVSHGEQVRDFNDVDDIAEAFVHALRAPASACGALYHVGSGRATTVRAYALAIAAVAGDPTLIRFGAGETPDQDLPSLVADPDPRARVLGWQPEHSLEERLRAATEWWLDCLQHLRRTNNETRSCFDDNLSDLQERPSLPLPPARRPPACERLSPRGAARRVGSLFPLDVHVCLDCGLIQVADQVPADYFRHYVYIPSAAEAMHGTSPAWQAAWRDGSSALRMR